MTTLPALDTQKDVAIPDAASRLAAALCAETTGGRPRLTAVWEIDRASDRPVCRWTRTV